MAPLNNLYEELKDQGFLAVGIESWTRSGPAILKQYREKFGVTFPLLYGGPPAGYGVWVTPSAVVLDRKGRPVAVMSGGECNWVKVRQLIRKLLAKSR